jgi:hypothetical protein
VADSRQKEDVRRGFAAPETPTASIQ